MQIAATRRELKANGKQSFAHLKKNFCYWTCHGKTSREKRRKEKKYSIDIRLSSRARPERIPQTEIKPLTAIFYTRKSFRWTFSSLLLLAALICTTFRFLLPSIDSNWEISVCCVHEIWLRVPHEVDYRPRCRQRPQEFVLILLFSGKVVVSDVQKFGSCTLLNRRSPPRLSPRKGQS